MRLVDRPPPPPSQSQERDGSGANAGQTDDANRSSKRWALVAALLCPCHLWLVAGVVGFFGAGAMAEAIQDNQLALVIILAPLTALALWKAVSAGRTAAVMKRDGESCAAFKG